MSSRCRWGVDGEVGIFLPIFCQLHLSETFADLKSQWTVKFLTNSQLSARGVGVPLEKLSSGLRPASQNPYSI